MKAKPAVANIITPHSLETLLLNLFNANSIKVAITIKGAVNRSSDNETLNEEVNPTSPSTRVSVRMLSPITLPITMSCSPARAAATDTANSGTTHPSATTVSPT